MENIRISLRLLHTRLSRIRKTNNIDEYHERALLLGLYHIKMTCEYTWTGHELLVVIPP